MRAHEVGYDVHGVPVRLTTADPDLAVAAETLLRHFRREAGPSNVEPDLVLAWSTVSDRAEIPVAPSPAAEVVFNQGPPAPGDLHHSGWKYTLYRDQSRKIADFHELGLFVVDDRAPRVEAWVVQPGRWHLDVRVAFLHMALMELLKRAGLYTIHATALAKGGRGVLIPAASGSGKTTACIALLRSGYRFLADDHPLLRDDGSGLRILSFPVKVDVTERTAGFFPELASAPDRLSPGIVKRHFRVEEVYGDVVDDACEPAVILIPQVVEWPTSHLEPLPRSRALEALLPETLLVLDREIARRQFRSLSRLVAASACYRLHFGADVLDLPRLVDPLLA